MPLCEGEKPIDPPGEAPALVQGRTCRLVGHVRVQDGEVIHLYPTADTGVWLEIGAGDVIEQIDTADPAKPSTIVVADRSRLVLRMDLTAADAISLMATAAEESAASARVDWRPSPRHRSPAGMSRRPHAVRKLPPEYN